MLILLDFQYEALATDMFLEHRIQLRNDMKCLLDAFMQKVRCDMVQQYRFRVTSTISEVFFKIKFMYSSGTLTLKIRFWIVNIHISVVN